MNLILIPIWLLSGAFFPAAGAPAILAWTMRLNPLTYGMDALRRALYLAEPAQAGVAMPFGPSVLISLAFAVAAFALASRTARRATTA